MYTSLKKVRASNGEEGLISCVLGPDGAYRDRVLPLLGHKGKLWQWHIEEALDRKLEDLQTRFYLIEIDGQPATNVCTFERGPVGILGHVYTRPEHRQKGLARALLTTVLEDFLSRGGDLLTLGTDYGSHAYRLYDSLGFREILVDSGIMQYTRDSAAEDRYWSPRSLTPARATWGDWPGVSLLMQQPGPVMRSVAFEVAGREDFEAGYLKVQSSMLKELEASSSVLRGGNGSVLGFATLTRDYRWHGSVWLLDHFLHRTVGRPQARALLDALVWPKGKVQAYVEAGHPSLPMLQDRGFVREGLLKSQFDYEGHPVDVEVLSRQAPE
ncbi:MAG TPA: GNAT family N-acetyltransferase [Armatimonadota bacterium]